jgi:hypothetical protein
MAKENKIIIEKLPPARLKEDLLMFNSKDGRDLHKYKGIFYGDNQERKYFEGGAHFNYLELNRRLKFIARIFSPNKINEPKEIGHEGRDEF